MSSWEETSSVRPKFNKVSLPSRLRVRPSRKLDPRSTRNRHQKTGIRHYTAKSWEGRWTLDTFGCLETRSHESYIGGAVRPLMSGEVVPMLVTAILQRWRAIAKQSLSFVACPDHSTTHWLHGYWHSSCRMAKKTFCLWNTMRKNNMAAVHSRA